QVLRPVVDHEPDELVETEQDRRDGEGDPQQHERLGRRIAAQHVRLRDRNRPQRGGHVITHAIAPWEWVVTPFAPRPTPALRTWVAYSGASARASSRRLAYSSRQAGQPSRWGRIPGICRS